MNSSYYSSVKSQIPMALDAKRNSAYLKALERVISPESVVLDLGAGLGTLGLYAAKLGAKHVYFVEPEPVIKLIPKLAKQNQVGQKITCLRGTIEEVSLPEKVDVIISVFTGNFLLEEDLLTSLFHARDNYLKEEGQLIPNVGEMWMVPISNNQFYKDCIEVADRTSLALDFSSVHQQLSNSIWPATDFCDDHYLATPQQLLRMDFTHETNAACDQELNFKVQKSGFCHGFIGWLDIEFDGSKLSTAPTADKTHWTPLYFPCETPIETLKGEIMSISVTRIANGPWMWSFAADGSMQRMSTLKALLETKPFKSKRCD